MDLIQLKAMGAITPRSLVQKDVSVRYPVPLPQEQWIDPEVAEYPDPSEYAESVISTHIRKRSSADFIEMLNVRNAEKPFIAILRCVCKPDGSQLFESFEQVIALQDWLWIPLMKAVNEVNEFGPKNSLPRTSSGARSRSPSAAGASRNGKKRSLKKSAPRGLPTEPNAAP